MKKEIILIFLAITSVINSQSLNENLLVHYPFSGNVNDVSGNNLNGIANAQLVQDRFDVSDEAYHFNGVDEFIDLPDDVSLKPNLPVSFSFWIKFDNLLPENAVIFTTDFEQDNHSGVWMNLSSSGNLVINYGDATGNTTSANRRSKVGSTDIVIDKWYHIVGIVNGPTEMEIFINCNNDSGFYQGTGGDLGYTLKPGSIGRKDANTNFNAYYFMGVLDDFRYWNKTLSDAEIESLCNETLSVTDTDKIIRNDFTIYPNPTNGILRIKSDIVEPEYIFIYDAKGILVKQLKYKSEINLKNLSSGLYFVKITSKNYEKLNVKRVIKL